MLIITEAKKPSFVWKRSGIVNQMFGSFVKMTLIRD